MERPSLSPGGLKQLFGKWGHSTQPGPPAGEGRDGGIQHPLHLLRPGLGLSPCIMKAVAATAAPCCAVSPSVLHNVASASKEGPSSAWLTLGSRPATAWSPCSPPACSSARPSVNRDPQITLKVRGMGSFQPKPFCDSCCFLAHSPRPSGCTRSLQRAG